MKSDDSFWQGVAWLNDDNNNCNCGHILFNLLSLYLKTDNSCLMTCKHAGDPL